MPNTLPPAIVEDQAVHRPLPATHGAKVGYTTGDTIPASTTSTHTSPAATPSSARSRSRSRDPFFRRAAAGENQEELQHQVIMDQVRHAQEGQYAADLERALRKSRTETGGGAEGGGASQSRSVSRIRQAIKSIVDDPFFHRGTAKTEEEQAAELHRIILNEVAAAKAAAAAGREDRAKSRSRSRARGEGGESLPGSRSQSRVRTAVGKMLSSRSGSVEREATKTAEE